MSRLVSLEKKLDRDPAYAEKYYKEMERLFHEGYAVVTDATANHGKVQWYIPHFGVCNRNKPEKVRLVFDAAYRYQGVSLNDKLLPGPDLIRSLLEVL